jgi:undecaprenyl-diphosphatase
VLSAWDAAIFRAIHLGWHRGWLDAPMMFLTDPGAWKLPILFAAGACFLLRGLRGAVALGVLALTLTASDQLSSHVLKPLVHRTRPSVALADSKPLFGRRRSYSFPSTHAANFTAAAPVLATAFPAAAVPYAVLASLVCLSRVYVGDHYPGDVLGGAALGLLLGWLGRVALLRLWATIDRRRRGGPVRLPASRGGGDPSASP